jgi:hypothetical protein
MAIRRNMGFPLAESKFDKDLSKKKKRKVTKHTSSQGYKIKTVETRGGKLKETFKDPKTGYKKKKVSKEGVTKKIVEKIPKRVSGFFTTKNKEVKRGKKTKVKTKRRR